MFITSNQFTYKPCHKFFLYIALRSLFTISPHIIYIIGPFYIFQSCMHYRIAQMATKIDNQNRILSKTQSSNPQPIGFSGILLAKRQNSFYCTYFLHNRNVADTKSPYPIKRLEVIRWFNQKSMVFNQSLS